MGTDTTSFVWLSVTCNGQFIKRDDSINIVAGQVGKIKFTFTLSDEWESMTIYARFKNGSLVYDVVVADDGSVTIPHEITDVVGTFQMAIRAEDDSGLIFTSDAVTVTVVQTIFDPNDEVGEPEPPTPSILKQILDGEAERVSNEKERIAAEEARSDAEIARKQSEENRLSAFNELSEKLETSVENASKATDAANQAASEANTAKDAANQAASEANTAKDAANQAASSATASADNVNSAIVAINEAENQRVSNEEARNEAEEQRVNNENSRSSQETSRVESEEKRNSEWTSLKTEINLATSNANSAAESANTAKNQIDQVINSATDAVESATNAASTANSAAESATNAASEVNSAIVAINEAENQRVSNEEARQTAEAERQEIMEDVVAALEALQVSGIPVYSETTPNSDETITEYFFIGGELLSYHNGDNDPVLIGPSNFYRNGNSVFSKNHLENSPLAGISVFGKTSKQNLWRYSFSEKVTVENFSMEISPDGYLLLNGEAGLDALNIGGDVKYYHLVPGKTYTLWYDSGSGFSIDVPIITVYDSEGTSIQTIRGKSTFVLSENSSYVTMIFKPSETKQYSDTDVYIMLNEGATNEPWIAPNLKSLGVKNDSLNEQSMEIKLTLNNKNLIPKFSSNTAGSSGLYLTNNKDGTYHCYGNSSKDSVFRISDTYFENTVVNFPYMIIPPGDYVASDCIIYDNEGGIIDDTGRTIDRPLWIKEIKTKTFEANVEIDEIIKPQLERGLVATEFEESDYSVYHINIGNNNLHGLSNTCRDELTVSSSGKTSIIKKIELIILNGSENWMKSSSSDNVYYLEFPKNSIDRSKSLECLCDRLKVVNYISDVEFGKSSEWSIGVYTGAGFDKDYIGVRLGNNLVSVDDIKTWFSSNPTRFFYPLYESNIIDVGFNKLPTILYSNSNIYMIDGGNVSDIKVTYWTQLGKPEAELQNSIMDLLDKSDTA